MRIRLELSRRIHQVVDWFSLTPGANPGVVDHDRALSDSLEPDTETCHLDTDTGHGTVYW